MRGRAVPAVTQRPGARSRRSSSRRTRRSARPATGAGSSPSPTTGTRSASAGRARFGSASAFSLIIESYWSIESSSVFAFMITSRFQNSAYLRMPGIFDWCGCHESAQTPFSEVTQTPSSVLTARLWLPSVWPGVDDDRDALAELDVAVEQHEVVLDHVVHAARHVPGPLHRVRSSLNVSTSLRWKRNFAFGKNGLRGSRLAVDRLRRAHGQAQVLHVEVVEADVVDVGRRDARTPRSPPRPCCRRSRTPCRRGTRRSA